MGSRKDAHALQKHWAKILLRRAVILHTGRSVESFQGYLGKHGKPLYRGLFCNISHTRGMVACAIGTGAVGVDCERMRPYPMATARRVCSVHEFSRLQKEEGQEAFFRLWTFKEAFVKMLGDGLSRPLNTVVLEGPGALGAAYPQMQVVQRLVGPVALCGVENPGGPHCEIQRLDLLS